MSTPSPSTRPPSPDPAAPGDAHVPPVPPWVALGVAVAAIAWAAPLVRLATAPALALSAWRLILSVALIAAVLVVRNGVRDAFPRLRRDEWPLAVAAGVMLALHFWSWIASVRYTTVASSVVLVSLQPFIIAILSVRLLNERPTGAQWVGIALGVTGAAVVGWGDLALGPRALFGDLLAFAAAWLVSGYYIVGRRLRARLDLWSYIGVVYGVAALVLALAVAVTPDVPFTGYPTGDWLVFAGLAAGPMMLGHTGVNYAIRYVPAYVANLAILGEPVLATLIAWALPAIGEVPPAGTLVGGLLILAGVAAGSGVLDRGETSRGTGP